VHARIVRSGFSQWFPDAHAQAPAWKMNMIVLLLLYPVVFLFGLLIQTPLLMRGIGLPFWLGLFIGNVASVLILSYLVPWVSKGFRWWLSTTPNRSRHNDWAGAGLIVGLYFLLMLAFSLI
jgi:antibiotic biosynthesis monooxygenase (ABM) superfamily enzyme